jgi:sortase (surface protein transpeptidase)
MTIRHKYASWLTAGAILLMLAGLLYLTLPKIQAAVIRHTGRSQNDQQVRAATRSLAPETRTAMTFGQPASLSLPRLGVALDILPGTYLPASKTWTLDSAHAFYMQPPEGMAAHVPIIYGHNIPAVFRKLDGVAPHEVLRITTQDGRLLLFTYVGDRVVQPDDDTAIRVSAHNTIFLITCTGSHFQQRRILQFEYLGSQQVSLLGKDTHEFFA